VSRIAQIEETRRKFLISALNISALTSSFALINACSQTPRKMNFSRSIYKLGGKVLINGQLATLETRIIPGDSIITGEKSYIIFIVTGESFILRSHSNMKLGEFRQPSPSIASIDLLAGKMLSVFAPRKPMLISTPQAIVSIRGTGVYVESLKSHSYVCTCYGETEIRSRKQPSIRETIKATHHDAPKYIRQDGQKSLIESAPFINHDDEELLLIETLVGRQTPYLVPAGVTRSRKTYY
jgi:hypothetical protein